MVFRRSGVWFKGARGISRSDFALKNPLFMGTGFRGTEAFKILFQDKEHCSTQNLYEQVSLKS